MILANGISDEFLALGVGLWFAINAAIALGEAFIFGKLCKIPLRRSFNHFYAANVASAILGIMTSILLHWQLYDRFSSIVDAYKYGSLVTLLGIMVYFVKTVIIESGILYASKLRKDSEIPTKQFLKAILYANIASYIVIGGIYFYYGRPIDTNLTLSDIKNVAGDCADTIYYCNNDSWFCKINADGTGAKQIAKLPDRYDMDRFSQVSYIVTKHQAAALITSHNDDYLHIDFLKERCTVINNAHKDSYGEIEFINISPSGKKVAKADDTYLKIITPDKNIALQSEELNFLPQGLYWTDNNTVIIEDNKGGNHCFTISELEIKKNGIVSSVPPQIQHYFLNRNYRESSSHMVSDNESGLSAKTSGYFYSKLSVSKNDKKIAWVDQGSYGFTPDLMPSIITMSNIMLLSDPSKLVWATDQGDILIIDAKTLKFAKLTNGHDALPVNRFSLAHQ